ncbi:flippase [Pseudomonas turukhanskensis]|uniref:O-unit flippase n=1 Tax=Pseudomonas turukhanskensis TaxID=1806536 RepID=A0A9W6NFL3_9PSED|nr:flippase [Pseudomonas turukhanskensis]GLK88930.1 O-unit flippase [Pseudomonas turukhanskensis]
MFKAALLRRYQEQRKLIWNIAWLFGDKVFLLLVNFLVAALVARHLGPEQFGQLSYVVSIVALFAVSAHAGLGGIVVKRYVEGDWSPQVVAASSLFLKLSSGVVGYLLLVVVAYFSSGWGQEFMYLVIAGLVIILQPLSVFDFWFQSQVKSKYVSVSNMSSLVLSAVAKVSFVYVGFSVLPFVLANLLQYFVYSLLVYGFFKKVSKLKISLADVNLGLSLDFLRNSWPVFLGSIFAMVYMKIDQVMLKWMVGPAEVGIYSVGAQLSEVWYFIPAAILTSYFPRLVQLKTGNREQYVKYYQALLDCLLGVAVAVALFMTFFADAFIHTFWGKEYAASASVLTIHIWAGVFVFMRTVFSKWIVVEGALIFSLVTQGLGAVINVALNFYFIPASGAEGAAYATLISYGLASYASLFFYAKTREFFYWMTKSFFLPVRLVIAAYKRVVR